MREKLKQERIKQKLTQKELADKVGISRVHYTQIENASNGKTPSLEVALKIKTALGYGSDDLFINFDVSENEISDNQKCRFVENVIQILNECEITRNQMLTDLHLSKNSFIDWKKRGTIPSASVVSKIAKYLGTSVPALLGDSKVSESDSPDVQIEKCQMCDISSEKLIEELKRRGYKVFKEV